MRHIPAAMAAFRGRAKCRGPYTGATSVDAKEPQVVETFRTLHQGVRHNHIVALGHTTPEMNQSNLLCAVPSMLFTLHGVCGEHMQSSLHRSPAALGRYRDVMFVN